MLLLALKSVMMPKREPIQYHFSPFAIFIVLVLSVYL